jgi:hypothetical protein
VMFRSPQPNEETMNVVLNEFKENNIDVSKLGEFRGDHCQQTELSTEGGSCE